jgi:hypothetical protein
MVMTRLGVAQDNQRREYDSRHRELQFQIGEQVLMYKPFRKVRRAEKLLHRWQGPFTVIRQTTPANNEVKLSSGARKSDIVHVVMMKHFHELLEQETNVEDDSTEATTDTLPPGESPPSGKVQQKDGTVIENQTDGASSFPDDGAAPVPRPKTVRKPKTTSRQARLPKRIQPARRKGRPDR